MTRLYNKSVDRTSVEPTLNRRNKFPINSSLVGQKERDRIRESVVVNSVKRVHGKPRR